MVDALQLSGPRCGDNIARPVRGFEALANCWDAHWYLKVAAEGYPAALPPAGSQSTLAFFPGYPALIAAGQAVGCSPLVAAVTVSLVAGGIATLLVWRLALAVADPPAAASAALLFAAFPGAAVFSWAYSEGVALALATGALLLLHRRRWVAAGLVAALAGAVRGDVWLGVCAAAVTAALLELRHGGERRSLAAPALAPVGGLAFLGYLWCRTGSPTAWTQAQSRGWGQHMDSGSHALRTVGRVLVDPLASPSRAIQAVAVLLFVAGAVALTRRPVPPAWLAYTVVVVVISLTSNQVGFRPRALLLAGPAFVAAGGWLGPRASAVAVAVLAVLQVLAVVLWLGATSIVAP